MYLHLGQDTVIRTDSITGIFDIDACTVSKRTRDFLAAAEKNKCVFNVSFELPRSFIVCNENGKTKIYVSQISTKTILSRYISRFNNQ